MHNQAALSNVGAEITYNTRRYHTWHDYHSRRN